MTQLNVAGMPEIDFAVESASIEMRSLTPLLNFRLRISETSACAVETIALHTQIQIEAARRPYVEREQEALLDLFGEPARWGRTLRTMLWTHASVVVPRFEGETTVELPVPCTYDLSVAAGKYFFALEAGHVPLSFQFSGTIFYRSPEDEVQISQIPWTKEAAFRLPVELWRRLMDEQYPGTAWFCLQRDVVDRLHRYKARAGLPSWDAAVSRLLAAAEEPATP